MARGRPKKDKPVEKAVQWTPKQYTDYRTNSARLRGEASRYSKLASEERGVFKQRTGFSAEAIAFVDKLIKFDDQLKAQNVMDEALVLFELAGFNDQGNLFSRAQQRRERDVKAESEEERDLRPNFLKGQQPGLPLDKAEKAFNAANEVAEAKKAVARKAKEAAANKAPKGSPLADPEAQVH